MVGESCLFCRDEEACVCCLGETSNLEFYERRRGVLCLVHRKVLVRLLHRLLATSSRTDP